MLRHALSPLASVHAAVILFGAAGLFGKLVALPAVAIVFGRVVFASLALVVLRRVVRRDRHAQPGTVAHDAGPGGHAILAGLGALLAVHWVTFFHAIQLSSVAVGLLTFAAFPVFTALIEPLLPGERFEPATLGAALVALAGIALVVPSPDPADPVVRGAFWGLVSGLSFALLSVANRGLVARWGAIDLALRQDAWAAVALAPIALATWQAPTVRDWALLAVLGVVFTAGAHALFLHGLSGVRAGRASVIASLEPVYGVALAALVLGERAELRTLTGGALVLVAATWMSRRPADRAGT